jgi:phosphoglycerol transferase MdoB-like AlkP superfamily enzyme
MPPQAPRKAARGLFWAGVWLAVAFVLVKASHLGLPRLHSFAELTGYIGSLAAISYSDVLFACAFWACGRLALAAVGRWSVVGRTVSLLFVTIASFWCVYAVVSVVLFGIFGGFLTYPLLNLVGDVRMVRSSVSAHLTPGIAFGLLSLPLTYLALVAATTLRLGAVRAPRWMRGIAAVLAVVWVVLGEHAFARDWTGRADRRVAENPQWVLLASWWQAVRSDGVVRMPGGFPEEDLADFEPIGAQRPSAPATFIRRASVALSGRVAAARRPPNVILIVLESVGARWTSLNNPKYETTPVLRAESSKGVVFDSFYAHIGRSSNSLASMLLSTYPKLDFRELTEQYPNLPGTSLAAVFRDHGYRTAFITPSDMSWAGWTPFLSGRGFANIWDYHKLSCSQLLSSWGVEDRCMVDAMVQFVEDERARPFFLMAWSQQTHHPYEPTPGVPALELLREPTPDDYELGRYLNVLHETDSQLAHLFDAVRRTGLENETLIIVTGDHGQAFGFPHDTYIQGRTVYEEDVNVPLMFWYPRTYRTPSRSNRVGSLVDLAPTITDLVGFAPASDWQGRSLFDSRHAPRAYFYVAEDQFTLGMRESNWKYIFNLRDGTEELYDLERDPTEQHNVAHLEPERCRRLRQRLAAWTEANHRQYERLRDGK